MKNYLAQAQEILNHGHDSSDRTGVGTLALFGQSLRFPLVDLNFKKKLPIVTTRKVPILNIVHEIVWFLSGSTDVKYLKDNNVSIWDDWVIPSTATFKPTEKQTAQDMSTWLRCLRPNVFKAWKKFQSERGNPVETIEDIQSFIRDFGAKGAGYDAESNELAAKLLEIPKVTLASGSIGTGAYGALWRKWEDTRIVTLAEAGSIHYKDGYEYVCHIPPSNKFGVLRGPEDATGNAPKANVVITRNIDQIADAIKLLKHSPDSRRIIVTAWNPGRIQNAVLPPCHSFFTFNTRLLDIDERLSYAKKVLGFVPDIQDPQIGGTLDKLNVPTRALTLMLVCR